MIDYINRYGDKFTFTVNDDGDIIWKGNFEYNRVGYPNDYKPAYQAYCKDASDMGVHKIHMQDFIEAVHENVYDAEGVYLHAGPIQQQYGRLVKSITSQFCMVDPSGGPYIETHQDLGSVHPKLKGLSVRSIVEHEDGYKIYTYRSNEHLQDRETIGGLTV